MPPKFVCSKCGLFDFPRLDALHSHIVLVHYNSPLATYNCLMSSCPALFATELCMLTHVMRKHKAGKLDSQVQKEIPIRTDIYQRLDESINMSFAQSCSEQAPKDSDLTANPPDPNGRNESFEPQTSSGNQKSMPPKIMCSTCFKSGFPRLDALHSHIVLEHYNGPRAAYNCSYNCSSCSARFTTEFCMLRHVRKMHQPGDPDSPVEKQISVRMLIYQCLNKSVNLSFEKCSEQVSSTPLSQCCVFPLTGSDLTADPPETNGTSNASAIKSEPGADLGSNTVADLPKEPVIKDEPSWLEEMAELIQPRTSSKVSDAKDELDDYFMSPNTDDWDNANFGMCFSKSESFDLLKQISAGSSNSIFPSSHPRPNLTADPPESNRTSESFEPSTVPIVKSEAGVDLNAKTSNNQADPPKEPVVKDERSWLEQMANELEMPSTSVPGSSTFPSSHPRSSKLKIPSVDNIPDSVVWLGKGPDMAQWTTADTNHRQNISSAAPPQNPNRSRKQNFADLYAEDYRSTQRVFIPAPSNYNDDLTSSNGFELASTVPVISSSISQLRIPGAKEISEPNIENSMRTEPESSSRSCVVKVGQRLINVLVTSDPGVLSNDSIDKGNERPDHGTTSGPSLIKNDWQQLRAGTVPVSSNYSDSTNAKMSYKLKKASLKYSVLNDAQNKRIERENSQRSCAEKVGHGLSSVSKTADRALSKIDSIGKSNEKTEISSGPSVAKEESSLMDEMASENPVSSKYSDYLTQKAKHAKRTLERYHRLTPEEKKVYNAKRNIYWKRKQLEKGMAFNKLWMDKLAADIPVTSDHSDNVILGNTEPTAPLPKPKKSRKQNFSDLNDEDGKRTEPETASRWSKAKNAKRTLERYHSLTPEEKKVWNSKRKQRKQEVSALETILEETSSKPSVVKDEPSLMDELAADIPDNPSNYDDDDSSSSDQTASTKESTAHPSIPINSRLPDVSVRSFLKTMNEELIQPETSSSWPIIKDELDECFRALNSDDWDKANVSSTNASAPPHSPDFMFNESPFSTKGVIATTCPICHMGPLASAQSMVRHVKTKHPDHLDSVKGKFTQIGLPFACTICNKSFTTEASLRLHKRRHDEELNTDDWDKANSSSTNAFAPPHSPDFMFDESYFSTKNVVDKTCPICHMGPLATVQSLVRHVQRKHPGQIDSVQVKFKQPNNSDLTADPPESNGTIESFEPSNAPTVESHLLLVSTQN
ncbi:hypothetical protein Ddc_13753 [Ditylenchus destructor]|nr:hypothetical protein Ddc_13753 [Ditylenchus destructor]